jgi:F-type H+-transporting ATPase subunit gamma
MAFSTKVIQKRIKSVKNTKKITKAMEMVASAKMRKAVQSVALTKDYTKISLDVLSSISTDIRNNHPLTKIKKKRSYLYVVITSNRGLCGNFNNAVFVKTRQIFKDVRENKKVKNKEGKLIEPNIDVLAIGNKAVGYAKKLNSKAIAVYDNFTDTPKFEETVVIANTIVEEYLKGNYDYVGVIYTYFISGIQQEVKEIQLLPLINSEYIKNSLVENNDGGEFEFEPDKNRVLDYLLPKLVELYIYQSILESAASEHSSRRTAMKNASDSAQDMVHSLSLIYNKERQSAITQEISEIVNAASAVQ